MDGYVAAKARIFLNQGPDDVWPWWAWTITWGQKICARSCRQTASHRLRPTPHPRAEGYVAQPGVF
jgi:UDP-N-acetylmuramoylalanine--D-glutamate ligase